MERIKQIRVQLGITRRELAEKVGISTLYVYDIETGRRTPSVDTLRKLAVALDATVDELLKQTKDGVSDCEKV